MFTESAAIVQRLWSYCNVLRDDVSYGEEPASTLLQRVRVEREVRNGEDDRGRMHKSEKPQQLETLQWQI
jgi:hypothetical protein